MKASGVILSWLVVANAAFAGAPACQVEHADFRGWKSFKLSNGLVSLYVVPDIGGRVIQFQLADHVAVTVTSPADAHTGIQLSRTISLFAGGTQVRHECVMKNVSRRPVRWAIWEVVQHDTADPKEPAKFNDDFWAYTPLNPHSAHPHGFSPMFGQANHASWRPDGEHGLLAVKYDHRVGKVGLDSNAGWLAVANGQSEHCFVARFRHFKDAMYPDHATVEFWLNGAGEFVVSGANFTNAPDPKEMPYFMESEILSPLADLEAGEEYRFTIDWFATRCPKPIVDVTSAGMG